MTEITPLSPTYQAAVLQRLSATRPPSTSVAVSATDRLEISTAADLLARITPLSDVRHDLVASIRHQILTGTYDLALPARIDHALDRLAQDL